jgi:hypothetical protein
MVERDQLATAGTQAAKSNLISPRKRRNRRNERSALTINNTRLVLS